MRTASTSKVFEGKYRKPSGARMIFSTNPKGLALLVREEHELPLPVVMETLSQYDGILFSYFLIEA